MASVPKTMRGVGPCVDAAAYGIMVNGGGENRVDLMGATTAAAEKLRLGRALGQDVERN